MSSKLLKYWDGSVFRTPKTPRPQTSTIGDMVVQSPQKPAPLNELQDSKRTEGQQLEDVHGTDTSAVRPTTVDENPVD
jgi:hypothetical protein